MQRKALVLVNLAVLLFGLAGLFAKWVRLPALEITFGRVLFSSIALGLYMRFRGWIFESWVPRIRGFCLFPASSWPCIGGHFSWRSKCRPWPSVR